jgi:hypothetical protein
MNKTIFVIFVLLSAVSISCEYSCPGYPESELGWIPFKLNDTLKYINQDEIISFIVNDKYVTEYSTFRGLYMDVFCDYTGYYLTSETNYNYKLREENSSRFRAGMKIQITENDKFEFDNFNMASFSDSIKVSTKRDTLIRDCFYSEVYLLSKDTFQNKPRISYLIKTRKQGVIEFYDFSLKKKWNLLRN